MISATQRAHIRPVHPFPARMAPSIVWDVLPSKGRALNILDPMSGSGTTLVCARSRGHHAIGCDTDPLALLISRAWCTDLQPEALKARAALVLARAMTLHKKIAKKNSYPANIDKETRGFIDFWFDPMSRRELVALASCISRVRSPNEKTLLWCAFSRMIITKTAGVSLAMDVSHSRPHKVYAIAPLRPFDIFSKAVSVVARHCPFRGMANDAPPADIRFGDARALPVESASIDMVITSPPYLNAIDYLRGHKLSLVWMGENISRIRSIRAGNIGAEIHGSSMPLNTMQEAMDAMLDSERLDNRYLGMIRHYIIDMSKVMEECTRVLKYKARAIFVIGDSSIRGQYVKNSEALIRLANGAGLSLVSRNTRPIETKRRYLPPPESERAGNSMQGRMREEVILEFRKEIRTMPA